MTDVIVTGLPRSGLTVVAALIDHLPDAVCLNAPQWQAEQARKLSSLVPYCKWLVGDFAWTRVQLLRQLPIRDNRAADGIPLLDSIRDPRQPKKSGDKEGILFARPNLKKDFTLGMKHHALYTAILPQLVEFEHFKVIAVIRHPLDVVRSWQQLETHAIAQGKLPMAARFWPEAARISSSKSNKLERMVQLYDAHLERYHSLRDKIHIVKYEDAVSDPMVISRLFDVDVLPASSKLIEERPRVRVSSDADEVREYFKKYGVFTKHYYPKL
jgi:hypothetical protein